MHMFLYLITGMRIKSFYRRIWGVRVRRGVIYTPQTTYDTKISYNPHVDMYGRVGDSPRRRHLRRNTVFDASSRRGCFHFGSNPLSGILL